LPVLVGPRMILKEGEKPIFDMALTWPVGAD